MFKIEGQRKCGNKQREWKFDFMLFGNIKYVLNLD